MPLASRATQNRAARAGAGDPAPTNAAPVAPRRGRGAEQDDAPTKAPATEPAAQAPSTAAPADPPTAAPSKAPRKRAAPKPRKAAVGAIADADNATPAQLRARMREIERQSKDLAKRHTNEQRELAQKHREEMAALEHEHKALALKQSSRVFKK